MDDFIAKYRKFLVAIAGVVVSILTDCYGNADWLPFLIQILTALGVYAVPNKRTSPTGY